MRKLVIVIVAAVLCFEPLRETAEAQAPIVEATRARVRALHASGSATELTLVDGASLRARIIRADADSFLVKEEKTGREVLLQYAQLVEIRKTGLPGNTKRAIAAVIIGGVLVVLCFAPFPLGFLCQEDPS
jgi:hypothetical protein